MKTFCDILNWFGVACGGYVVYKLTKLALKKENK